MSTLLTGFPGFVATALLERLLERRPDEEFVCLVERRALDVARKLVAEFERRGGGSHDRLRLVEGDITDPVLGLDGAMRQELAATTQDVFHLAAVYDVSVSRETATRVNVDGTRHVARFAASCSRLRRLHHVSSFGVAGHHPGVFTEDDLDVGQPFRNHYVESKFEAERFVRDMAGGGLPVTVHRPAYVVGDSHTGATQKYDGPYFLIRWILRQPRSLSVVPTVGDPHGTHPNIVPRDFVADAIAHLAGLETSLGTTYQLVDPEPPDLAELIDLVASATGHRVLHARVPVGPTKWLLGTRVGGRIAGMPPEVLDYFDHPTLFTCDHTLRDLGGSGIRCPSLETYLPRLVEFVRQHPVAPDPAAVMLSS